MLAFAKDTVYRFMKSTQINWIRFTTILASRIIKDAVVPLNNADRENVLCIDDSMFERNRSKKVELLAKTYDHAKHAYKFGFRMLTLGWTDGSTFLPVNSILLSTDNKKNRVNEAVSLDKRTVGYKRRKLSMTKGTEAMLELLKASKTVGIPAKYVLFDSWYFSPKSLHAVKNLGYEVIGMIKKTPKMFFRYNGEELSLIDIYKSNKKRRGRSRYLLLWMSSKMGKRSRPGWYMSATGISARNTSASSQQIHPYVKMKSFAFMENAGISKYSSKSARVISGSVKNAIAFLLMQ